LLTCGLAAISAVAPLSAQPGVAPSGSEFKVVGALPGDQVNPDIAVSATGGIIVWEDNTVSFLGSRIRAARLNSNLQLVGTPIVISNAKSKTVGNQDKPKVALLPNGGAVVVWQQSSRGKKAQPQQVFARFVGPNGELGQADIRVGSNGSVSQSHPNVAVLADGTVVVVWSSGGQDGSMQGVFAQLLSSTGAKIGGEFQANAYTLFNQRNPAVAALSNGGFVVCWISELQRNPASSVDVFARLFNSVGVADSSEIAINTTTTNACANPAVAASENGFCVTWSQRADSGRVGAATVSGVQNLTSDGWDVYGRMMSFSGDAQTDAFRVNSTAFGDQYAPKVIGLSDRYLVAWNSQGQDGSRGGIYGQAVSEGGALLGEEIRINTVTRNRQFSPALSNDGNNRVLAAWSSFAAGTSFDVAGQIYVPSQE
jgi:hypothetical protein